MKTLVHFILLAFFFVVGFMKASKAQEQPVFEHIELNTEIDQITPLPTLGSGSWDEFSPLYREILSELGHQYQAIGERQARQVLDRQNGFYLGGFNNVGFSYARDFGHFDINVERQIAPDLFDDERWIVTDRLHIIIDASKLFDNLRQDGLVNMTDAQHALFAGIQFRRTYRYVHFADSYQEGLVFNLNKLFLAFQKLRGKGYLELDPYEIIQREDYLSASVGGMAMAPLGNGLGVTVGALAKWHQIANLEVQAVGPEDQASEGERLRLSFEKTRGILLGVNAGLHAEFLKFLRFTLLSYDFHYSLEESQKTYLSFDAAAAEELAVEGSELGESVANVLKSRLQTDLTPLAPYIVSHEQRKLERKHSKYMVLLFGGHSEQKTEYIELVKDGLRSIFFRHNFEKIKFVENFWSRLIAVLVRSSLQLNSLVNHDQVDSKKVRIEYQASHNLLDNHGDLTLLDQREDLLSLNFDREYFSAKSKKSAYKKLSDLLATFSGVDPLVQYLVESEQMQGPMRLKAKTTVTDAGIRYLNDLRSNQAAQMIEDLCSVKPRSIFSFFRSLFGSCRSKLSKAYDNYWRELNHHEINQGELIACRRKIKFYWGSAKKQAMMQKCLELASYKGDGAKREVPLWRLKDFAQTLHDESDNKIDLFHFFGLENVFLHGSFEGRTDGAPFITHFNEGRFRALGAVDSFMRAERLRVPASVVVE